MIKVVFPPGCYGSFLTKCLYTLTDLGYEPDRQFVFDAQGSSHDHWYNQEANSVILWGHLTKADFRYTNTNVVILPRSGAGIEYYVNQFVKSEAADPVRFLLTQFDQKEIEQKLQSNWDMIGKISDAPVWVLREFLSLSIRAVFDSAYNRAQYGAVQSTCTVETDELFDNLGSVLSRLCEELGLELCADTDTVQQIQTAFVQSQRYRNLEEHIYSYVQAVIAGEEYELPEMNFVIESYIQYSLARQGIELSTDGVVGFPLQAGKLKI